MSKEFKVRALLLCKTMGEWAEIERQTPPFIPALGEVCIYTGNIFPEDEAPEVVLKVGDGVHPLSEVQFVSAKAGDVYAWAKQEAPNFEDFKGKFLTDLDDHIKESFEHDDTQYRIQPYKTSAGSVVNYRWQLEKKGKKDDDWVVVSGSDIDASELNNRLTLVEDTMVKKEAASVSDNTKKSYVTNDGVKAELSYKVSNATVSSVSVNASNAQVVAKNEQTSDYASILVLPNGAFYLHKAGETGSEDNRIVTKGEIKDIESITHLLGVSVTNPVEALPPTFDVEIVDKGTTVRVTPKKGDIVFYNKKEFLYIPKTDESGIAINGWTEIGDESIYITKAEAEERFNAINSRVEEEEAKRAADDIAEAQARSSADEQEAQYRQLADSAEESARLAADDAEKQARIQADSEEAETREEADIILGNRIDNILEGKESGGLQFSKLIQTDGVEIILNCNAN